MTIGFSAIWTTSISWFNVWKKEPLCHLSAQAYQWQGVSQAGKTICDNREEQQALIRHISKICLPMENTKQ